MCKIYLSGHTWPKVREHLSKNKRLFSICISLLALILFRFFPYCEFTTHPRACERVPHAARYFYPTQLNFLTWRLGMRNIQVHDDPNLHPRERKLTERSSKSLESSLHRDHLKILAFQHRIQHHMLETRRVISVCKDLQRDCEFTKTFDCDVTITRAPEEIIAFLREGML